MPGYWNSKSDIEVKNEITSQLSIKSLDFIGRYRKHTNGFTYFDNIRLSNFSPLPKIKSNKDDKLINVKVIVHLNNRKDLKNGAYYHFTGKIIPQNLRIKHKNEFIFTVEDNSEIIEYKPNAKDFIDSIYERFDKADSANNNDISKALNTITYQINKKPETFIYELLQNADDNAGNRDINITFYITDKYLLVFHNGDPFKFNNVFAICSVNAEDKSDDIDKIGFKGIGFKSVFKDNDWVFINSGEYSFRFDQSIYSVEKPWQLMPVWTTIDKNLEISIRKNDRFLSENVSIALRPKDNDPKLLSKYSKTLELFNDDRILLFLKKVRQVHVSLQNKEKIHCRKHNANWDIRDYTIEVTTEIKAWLNEQIRNNNQEVPIKYQDLGKFKISYAYKVENGKVVSLADSSLFNYLPLSISLGFPFLVNSDFIPDGDREELYLNIWNEYIMIEIGRCLPKFISDIVSQKTDCFQLLPESAKNNFLNSKWNQLYDWFLHGYIESLTGENPIAFIPTKSGSLETLSNILIDETGLSELLGDEFTQLTGLSEKLIDSNVGEGIEKIKVLISQHKVGEVYNVKRLMDDIKTNLQDWLKQPANNFRFIEHLCSNSTLEGLLKTEEVVLSNSGDLCKATDVFFEVPEELIFLSPKQVNKEVLILINEKKLEIEFKTFETIQFIKDSILGKTETLNASFNNESNLLLFWQYIFNNWSKIENDIEIINSLKDVEILCKSVSPEGHTKCVISEAYLSKEFNLPNEIESTVQSIIPDGLFISDKYISISGDKFKWRKIFHQLGVIDDLQKVIGILLPNLPYFNEQQHYIIAKQIFKYWKGNKEKETRLTKEQIVIIRNDLKIKCIDNIYRYSSACIISDHFQTNKIIETILEVVSLSNQISSDYGNSQISEWNTFFKEIGCISLDEKQQVLEAKLLQIVSMQDELQNSHLEYIKGIYSLYNSKNTIGLNIDFVNTLSQIKLKTIDNEFKNPSDIHLSSIYKPKIDIQADESFSESDIKYLSTEYFQLNIDKYFLIKMGVNEAFRFNKRDLRRHEIPTEYKNELENRYKYISHNASSYGSQHRLLEHVELNYKFLLTTYKYSLKFWDEVTKPNSNFVKLLFQKSTYKTAYNSFVFENYFVNFLKNNPTIPNQLNELKIPTQLYSFKFKAYVADKSVLPKYDFSEIFFNDERTESLECILGIRSELSPEVCIELLSRTDNQLTIDEISNLGIVEILNRYKPTVEELKAICLPNVNLVWKPISQLFISKDNQFQLDSSLKLHENYISLAENFGVNEISEQNVHLKVFPEAPIVSKDVDDYFNGKATFIAFKINQLNWEEVVSILMKHLTSFKFYEVELISKVFPKDEPIYEQHIDFYFDEKKMEVFYKGFWKNNRCFIEFLYSEIINEKINKGWFENIIYRWDNDDIIKHLSGDFPDAIPNEWIENDWPHNESKIKKVKPKTIKDILPDATDEEIAYISEIINISRDKDGQIDANTTAKIKTLKYLKASDDASNITDKDRYLQVDSVKIIVRSAQKGLLYLDLYDWEELDEVNVKIAIYTNNKITIFDTQEDLFKFCRPQNKFGVLRMPNDYSLEDYNSLDDIKEKSKWHFVFIVNKDAKAAKSYEELLNLEDYNF